MTRTVSELRKIFKRKITIIEKNLDLIFQEEPLSELRQEVAIQIAVILRAMFCYSGGESLIKTAQMEDSLYFPLYDSLTPFNELGDYLLVGNQCKNSKCTFLSDTSSINLDGTQVPTILMTYYSWVNQIVIDLKTSEYAPLSRNEIIKIVADKVGAHVDTTIHPFVELIESTNVMPFHVVIAGEECLADCSNLLTETIITIAKEVVFAYKYLNKPPIMKPRHIENDFYLRIYDYSYNKHKLYKYTICADGINLYNTNKYWSCKISSHPIKHFDLLFRKRVFPVDVIKIENCILD